MIWRLIFTALAGGMFFAAGYNSGVGNHVSGLVALWIAFLISLALNIVGECLDEESNPDAVYGRQDGPK